jgi:class 3 adenylate cyclase
MASLEDDVVEVARARGRVAGKGRAVPTSHGNDEMRAARCALGMIERRRRLSEESGRTVEIGIGVAYGELVAGCMGSEDRLNYTVLGDRVNLASRLRGFAVWRRGERCLLMDRWPELWATNFERSEGSRWLSRGFPNRWKSSR